MAGQAVLKGIKDSWSLLDYARKNGAPKRAKLTNSDTGEEFAALMFPTPQTLPDGTQRDFTMVAFSSNLGELSAADVAARKEELQVVQLESGNYYLCVKGNGAWEDINLF